tara:strand:+ start:336 stop:1181 length:846 start_codon:yes stop_codon:yes gene_type:complete
MSKARGLYRLKKEIRDSSKKLSKSASRKSAWSKIGMGLGGLAAALLTGGAAAPAVAAALAAGGSAAGGIIGRQLAKSQRGGNYRGGRFYKEEAEAADREVNKNILMGSLKAGATAGLGKMIAKGTEGATVSVGKGGVQAQVNPNKFKMEDLFKGGESTHTYSDTLMGKLGKTIDYKGSFIGKNIPNMEWGTLPEGMSPREYQSLIAERQGSYAASEAAGTFDFSKLADGPSAWENKYDPIREYFDPFTGSPLGKMRSSDYEKWLDRMSGNLKWQDRMFGGK